VKSSKQVPCPRCGTLSLYAPENKWRPFCSERCRLIDLGQWATDGYSIPIKDQTPPDSSGDA